MNTGELVVCTTSASWIRTTEVLRAQGADSPIKIVVLARDKNSNEAPWIWQESCSLKDLDRSNNPLLIYGAVDLWDLGVGKQFEMDVIRDSGIKGVTFQNMNIGTWDLTDCEVQFIDCPGAPQ